jgi:hypothetical protein
MNSDENNNSMMVNSSKTNDYESTYDPPPEQPTENSTEQATEENTTEENTTEEYRSPDYTIPDTVIKPVKQHTKKKKHDISEIKLINKMNDQILLLKKEIKHLKKIYTKRRKLKEEII